jgi:hypothetical protein
MDCLMADSDYPGLGVWVLIASLAPKAIEEFLGGGHGLIGLFKVAGFDVDHKVFSR